MGIEGEEVQAKGIENYSFFEKAAENFPNMRKR
jgi:hypothetical protein